MDDRAPGIGDIVHFVSDTVHRAAIITDTAYMIAESAEPSPTPPIAQVVYQALIVLPPMQPPFNALALYDAGGANATWHWAADDPKPAQLPTEET
jgi:hypothetical protein